MSDMDLPTLAEREREKARQELKTPMNEIDAALKACTFGRYHIKLLLIVFLGFVSGVIASSSTAYLLPSAECDLHMDLVQKGLLNGMPYMGMLLSSVVAGFLTDALGRKIFLSVGFGGLFVSMLIAGSSQTFEVLAAAKFLEGLLFATSFSACVTLTSEFCYSGIRDRVMLCQSSFIAIAQVLTAALSWAILTNDWRYSFFGGKFVLNTWNFYLYIMSLWSFGAFIMYLLLIPESPKYLLTQKKYDEAREILVKIYRENTGKEADTYPYYNLWKDRTMHSIDETPEHKAEMSVKHQIVASLYNVKPMFEKPLVIYLAMTCFTNFVIMATYNVLRLWFPQVSAIVEHNPLSEGEDLCSILDVYTSSLRIVNHNATSEAVCVPLNQKVVVRSGPEITGTRGIFCPQMKRRICNLLWMLMGCKQAISGAETYINSIILGFVCLFPYFITGMLVNKVGKKLLFIGGCLISVAAALSLRWANSKAAIVALFSIGVAINQTALSLNQAMTVEAFPTTMRTLAISLIMVIGRIGTLSGNIVFPIMLNKGCSIPFYTMSACMALVTFVGLFLPTKK